MDYRIEISKQARLLELYSSFGLESRHPVRLGLSPGIDKAVEGDGATPLGEFYVCAKNPRSKYFLSLCLSYPNAEDAQRGLREGLIDSLAHAQILEAIRLRQTPPQHTRLGGEIYIHGGGAQGAVGLPGADWTRGCIALDNDAIRDLYDRVQLGAPVTIRS
jgi:murein L,D-transpeptidase YafK